MSNKKFDVSRIKDKKYQKKITPEDFDDSEMLRIQGLIRCKECENPFPKFLDNCPVCE